MDHTEYDNYQYSGTCLETIAVKDHLSSFLAVIPVTKTPITTCLEIPYLYRQWGGLSIQVSLYMHVQYFRPNSCTWSFRECLYGLILCILSCVYVYWSFTSSFQIGWVPIKASLGGSASKLTPHYLPSRPHTLCCLAASSLLQTVKPYTCITFNWGL